MIELAQHIETLLLENDCVIIPGFGGFVAYYTSATQVKEENLFLPPVRTIGFNPQLKLNDGVLVQSYMAVYDTNFSDASRMVEKAAVELFTILHEEGQVDLENIGEIHYTVHDTYEFIPYNYKVTTPYLYGLDSFEMRELEVMNHSLENEQVPAEKEKEKKSYEIRINRSLLHNAVAMVAVVILFFAFSIPIENTYVKKNNYAQLLPAELFEQIQNQSVTTAPINIEKAVSKTSDVMKSPRPITVKEVKVDHPTAMVTPITTSKLLTEKDQMNEPETISSSSSKNVQLTNQGKYHIIVAGGIGLKVAEAMVSQLKLKGFPEAKVLKNEQKVRVCIFSCNTREEATKQMLILRENHDYQNAWLLAQ